MKHATNAVSSDKLGKSLNHQSKQVLKVERGSDILLIYISERNP